MRGGTILAVDGYVQPILAPILNLKSFWGITCLAACDAYGRFRFFDVKWPGSEAGIVCYRLSRLCEIMKNVGEEYHSVNDEAFISEGGSVFYIIL